ncbi:calcium-binding protein [Streptomyces cinnabarinus]|uniref:Calcium-binding protein n=1 Tax=Streptomyces cinnabarinus TaxID=67287 RepID=A0ABY7KSW7_9ACTN|nr:calcium-binding protein [Streptomyces cinnabarinus]WAZ26690.1 calcium-binding protein [Streptomyces cinnabarinus]
MAIPPARAAAADEITVDKVVVNGGKPVVVGTHAVVKFPIAVTATHASGVYQANATLFSPSYAVVYTDGGQLLDCAETKPTTTCTGAYTVDPIRLFTQGNTPAGTWKVHLHIDAWEDTYENQDKYTFKLLRATKLTANATPEPVQKGKTITVRGTLTRADWSIDKYVGFKEQPVKLQFRKKGSSTYTTVKTVTSGSSGAVTATATAGSDGYYRFAFAGTGTTASVNASGDFVDVR